MFYVDSYCGSLRRAWPVAGFKDSDNDACLSLNLQDFSAIEMRVDDWG